MCSKKRWGTALIEGLVKEKQEKEDKEDLFWLEPLTDEEKEKNKEEALK